MHCDIDGNFKFAMQSTCPIHTILPNNSAYLQVAASMSAAIETIIIIHLDDMCMS